MKGKSIDILEKYNHLLLFSNFLFLGLIISLGLIYIFVIGNVQAETEQKSAKGSILEISLK